MDGGDRSGGVVTVALAEFTALRAEISARSTAQYTLMNLNLTAVGLLLGAVLADRADLSLLVMLPLISSCFGILFFDHAAQIENIGLYCATRIRPLLLDAVDGDPRLLAWEESYRLENIARTPMLLRFGIPLVVIFLGAPVGSTIATVPALDEGWMWTLWVGGVLLEAVMIALWLTLVRKWSFRGLPIRRP